MNIRQASVEDVTGIANVHVASWKTTYAGIMPDGVLQNLCVTEREKMWEIVLTKYKDQTAVYVATTEDGTIIGFASGGKEQTGKFDIAAELHTIYLLEAYQGQGIGRKLFLCVVEDLQTKGYKSMMTWVVKNNPATKFYESFKPECIAEEYVEDLQVDEVAYAWRDLHKTISENSD
ncbi:GNAT family N-acetyltransferase [Priestia taiwanensis]|uniref:N-acetyltransferase n=1 Tax=Priestia taiwanensis TaxID=1347902 RepID=A0A917ATK8_9BACI|nr:GNAT family N-acetyltransferase [Priestia taiwanensis]MBM7363310.1 L-amino acid N-acyltransferase YncA [Priestia taiwanensis]GGE69373.1 N-acetyltransferase [Priestia taiwanensis]